MRLVELPCIDGAHESHWVRWRFRMPVGRRGPADVRRRAAGSEFEQVGDEFSNLLQRDGPDVCARRLDDAVDADGRRQVRLGDTEPG